MWLVKIINTIYLIAAVIVGVWIYETWFKQPEEWRILANDLIIPNKEYLNRIKSWNNIGLKTEN